MPASSRPVHLKLRILISTVLALVFVAAGVAVFGLLESLKKPPARVESTARRPAVSVVQMGRGSYREELTGYGKARALRQTRVDAEITGIVEWISPELEVGAAIEAGTELVRIDQKDLQSALDRALAETGKTRAKLEQTRIERDGLERRLKVSRDEYQSSRQELARSESLRVDDIVSADELDQQRRATRLLERNVLLLESQLLAIPAKIEWEEADLTRAEAAEQQARIDLEKAVIRAPYSGRIESRLIAQGGRVGPGSPLFQIVDMTRIEVPVGLPASRFADVRPGHRARLRLDESGADTWVGTVSRVSPVVNDAHRTFDAFLVVDGEGLEAELSPGTFLVATVEGRLHQDVVAVPRIAFVGEHVYVAERDMGETGDGVARQRTPTVIRWLPDMALVSAGLEAGEEVIITNLEKIGDETLLKIAASAPMQSDGADDDQPIGPATQEPAATGNRLGGGR